MLDSMDVMLYALVLGQVQRAMHLSAAMSGAMMSATLVAAAIGGIGFGWFADRLGRVRALTTQHAGLFRCHRPCAALRKPPRNSCFAGCCSAWAWEASGRPARPWLPKPGRRASRQSARSVQSSWAVGYAIGAAIVALVMPRFGWRAVFFAGIVPALITFWLRRGIREPEAWQRATEPPESAIGQTLSRRPRLQPRRLRHHERGHALRLVGTLHRVPRFLSMPVVEGGRGLSVVQTSAWTIVMQAGTFLGYVSFGYLADRFSRKYTYIGIYSSRLWCRSSHSFTIANALLLIGPLVGFFGTGYFSGFSVIASEFFPTALRGSAMGFVYNIGRIFSAAAPYLIGGLSEGEGSLRTLHYVGRIPGGSADCNGPPSAGCAFRRLIKL